MTRGAFDRLATWAAHVTGTARAAAIAFAVVLAWAVSGPFFRWSEAWQLVINTGTTIVTFLMVFLLQHAQDRDTRAIQLKLDELIVRLPGPRDELAGIERKDTQ